MASRTTPYLITLFLSLGIGTLTGKAQRKVIVPQGFGTLNEIIRKDTTAGGARKDPNTVYVLRRGGVYGLSGTILATNFHLRLEAEEGPGPLPFLRMGFLEGATQVGEVFEVRGDVTFRNIHLTVVNEFNTYIARGVSASAPNLKLRFYNCIIDRSGQTFIRLNSPGCSVFMLNCTVSRMGRPSDPDNGRVIDDRGNPVDSIVVENNTWYNITSRMIRDGGGDIKYMKMNQNTLVNGGQRFSSFGPVNQLIVTNNIIANPRFIGNTATSSLVATDFSLVGPDQVFNFNHNNIYYDAEVLSVWNEIAAAGGSRIRPPFVAPENQPRLNNAIGIINEPLAYTLRPAPPVTFIRELELGTGSSIQDWDWTGATAGNPWQLPGIAYHNFSYPPTTQSFTGSAKGEPLGDLRWFPAYDVAWTVRDLIEQAMQLLAREENNPILAGSPSLRSDLLNAIADAHTVAQDANASGLAYGNARDALRDAMNNFRASLVVTSQENIAQSVSAGPNPATDRVLVTTGSRALTLRVFDLQGRLHYHQQSSSGEIELELNQYPPGTYVLQIQTAEGTFTRKIIKL